MGAIWYPAIEFSNTMSELIGHKSGLALSREDFIEHLDEEPDWATLFRLADEEMIRIRSEEVEALVAELLYRIGNIDTPDIMPPSIRLYHIFKHDKKKLKNFNAIMEDYTVLFDEAVQNTIATDSQSVDPTDLLLAIIDKHGRFGFEVASEMIRRTNAMFHRSPWTTIRTVEWEDEKQLRDLFESEDLRTSHGTFFDQRFIDYLQVNFEKIEDINWRKFEGFAAEYLDRQGFSVDLGPGRNDDGVDIRAFPTRPHDDLPPTMIVQCKRERRKISKVIVKSLWADVVHEGAASGLIVTTSELSPGAARICKARGYPIEQANRNTLREWVSNMRTPGAGVFG
jgi:restriction system protein